MWRGQQVRPAHLLTAPRVRFDQPPPEHALIIVAQPIRTGIDGPNPARDPVLFGPPHHDPAEVQVNHRVKGGKGKADGGLCL